MKIILKRVRKKKVEKFDFIFGTTILFELFRGNAINLISMAMLRLFQFGMVKTITASMEPQFGIPVTNNPNTQSNLCVFMVLFMVCAIEVVFIKIVTAVNDIDDNRLYRNNLNDGNNNNEVYPDFS